MKLSAKIRSTVKADRLRSVISAALEPAVRAGAMEIENSAREKAPLKTGTLRRSIHTELADKSPTKVVARIGTDVPYARRIEFGFVGRDALGRQYNQGPRPYMRAAFEEEKGNAQTVIREVIAGALKTNFGATG